MKTSVLIYILLTVFFLLSKESRSQNNLQVDSIRVIPLNPDTNDTIYIALHTHTGTLSTQVYLNHSVTQGDVWITACYKIIGVATMEWYADTLLIGTLPAGTDKVHFTGYVAIDSSCASIWDSVKATDSFIIPDPESVAQYKLEEISLYPNPAQDEITLVLSDNLTATQILLRDIHGRLIRQYEGDNHKLDISGIPQGLYFLHIETNKGKAVLRFLKE